MPHNAIGEKRHVSALRAGYVNQELQLSPLNLAAVQVQLLDIATRGDWQIRVPANGELVVVVKWVHRWR